MMQKFEQGRCYCYAQVAKDGKCLSCGGTVVVEVKQEKKKNGKKADA